MTKQLLCWIIRRSTGSVEPSWYSRNWKYQGALTSSSIASVPRVSVHFSRAVLLFSAVVPPAAPDTVPLFSPILGAVAMQPARAATAADSAVRRSRRAAWPLPDSCSRAGVCEVASIMGGALRKWGPGPAGLALKRCARGIRRIIATTQAQPKAP